MLSQALERHAPQPPHDFGLLRGAEPADVGRGEAPPGAVLGGAHGESPRTLGQHRHLADQAAGAKGLDLDFPAAGQPHDRFHRAACDHADAVARVPFAEEVLAGGEAERMRGHHQALEDGGRGAVEQLEIRQRFAHVVRHRAHAG